MMLASIACVAPAAAQVTLIDNAKIYTVTGPGGADVIETGDVLIRDGVIAAVGREIAAPDGATVVDGAGKVVTPGLFAPWSQLGLVEIGLDDEANDDGPRGDFPLSAALDPRDAFNPASTLIPANRAGGVTRALVAPEAGSKLFGGQAIVVDLTGRAVSITKTGAGQSVVMDAGGARRAGNTRLGAWAMLREYLDEAKRYAANPRDYFSRRRDEAYAIADLEALGPVVAGDAPLIVAVDRAADIRTLLRVKSEYGINVIVRGGTEAWKVARDLAQADVPVILDPMANLPQQFEDLGSTLANAARLNAAGVVIAVDPAASGTHSLFLMPQYAGNAVANGLPYGAALAAMTLNPAKMYGLDARLGSLEVGKIADVVVWDGDPLETSTRPVAVYIDGRAQNLDTRQKALAQRYRTLDRGALPFAYRGKPAQ